jgi:hypothetical protein
MGFLQICAGVVLLQLSKSAKDVPDVAVFKGDLDQVRTVAEQEQPETEPKADAIRGTAAIIRRISVSRQKMEQEEARRLHDEKMRDQMEPINENEIIEWDGLRRRKTIIGESPIVPLQRRKTLHPPLGMSHFPTEEEGQRQSEDEDREHPGVLQSIRNRASSVLLPHRNASRSDRNNPNIRSPMHPVALTEISVARSKAVESPGVYGSSEHVYGLPAGLNPNPDDVTWGRNRGDSSSLAPTPPPHRTSRRQFSFQNVFGRARSDEAVSPGPGARNPVQSSPHLPAPSRMGLGSRQSSKEHSSVKNATEEERLGLVKGDSHATMFHDAQAQSTSPIRKAHRYSSSEDADIIDYDYRDYDIDSEEDWQIENRPPRPPIHTQQRPQPVQPNDLQSKPLPSTTTPGPSAPSVPTKTGGPSLPAHPAINVQLTSSPDREPVGLRHVGVEHSNDIDEYDDYDGRRWDQQAQQQMYQQQQNQQQKMNMGQERNITGIGKRKPKREGSGDSGSSVEEREIRDYEARSGRKGGDGTFI